MKVLIATADKTVRGRARRAVAELGAEPVDASSAVDAWTAYDADRFPLCVIDAGMPGTDASDLCHRIREADRDHETFILVVTAKRAHGDPAAMLADGADDYINRPAAPADLRARLAIARQRMDLLAESRAAAAATAHARRLADIGEISAALQHEINNPLSALLGHAELLVLEAGAQGPGEHVRVIHEQARRIADVVKRLGQLRTPTSVEYVNGARMLDLRTAPHEEP